MNSSKYKIKKFLSICFIISLILCWYVPFYGQNKDNGGQVKSPLLTLIGTIGGENLPSEYLLVWPGVLKVKDNGDILIPDEYKIKVFDSHLKPKLILGGKGEGPGEYRERPALQLAPNGYLTAIDNFSKSYYTLYDNNYKLVFKKQLTSSNQLISLLQNKGIDEILTSAGIIMLDPNSIILHTTIFYNQKKYFILIYEGNNCFTPIVLMEDLNKIQYKNISMSSRFSYRFYHEILSDSIVVYSKSGIDDVKFISDTKGEYAIHFFNFIKNSDEKVFFPFIPVIIPQESINEELQDEKDKNLRELIEKAYQKQKYYWPVSNINIDGDYLFLSISQMKMQVIDIRTKSIVYQGESFGIGLPKIHNGIAYDRETDAEGYYIYRLYKIHPAVYGK
jgi:hypothetical protein